MPQGAARKPDGVPYDDEPRGGMVVWRVAASVVKGFNHLVAATLATDPIDEGGALVHARGHTWGRLIFQDLLKKKQ